MLYFFLNSVCKTVPYIIPYVQVYSSLILAKSVVSYMYNVVMLQAIYMYVHWIGLVHWTSALDWWTGLDWWTDTMHF